VTLDRALAALLLGVIAGLVNVAEDDERYGRLGDRAAAEEGAEPAAPPLMPGRGRSLSLPL
jgi:hypothetical protein